MGAPKIKFYLGASWRLRPALNRALWILWVLKRFFFFICFRNYINIHFKCINTRQTGYTCLLKINYDVDVKKVVKIWVNLRNTFFFLWFFLYWCSNIFSKGFDTFRCSFKIKMCCMNFPLNKDFSFVSLQGLLETGRICSLQKRQSILIQCSKKKWKTWNINLLGIKCWWCKLFLALHTTYDLLRAITKIYHEKTPKTKIQTSFFDFVQLQTKYRTSVLWSIKSFYLNLGKKNFYLNRV